MEKLRETWRQENKENLEEFEDPLLNNQFYA